MASAFDILQDQDVNLCLELGTRVVLCLSQGAPPCAGWSQGDESLQDGQGGRICSPELGAFP